MHKSDKHQRITPKFAPDTSFNLQAHSKPWENLPESELTYLQARARRIEALARREVRSVEFSALND